MKRNEKAYRGQRWPRVGWPSRRAVRWSYRRPSRRAVRWPELEKSGGEEVWLRHEQTITVVPGSRIDDFRQAAAAVTESDNILAGHTRF